MYLIDNFNSFICLYFPKKLFNSHSLSTVRMKSKQGVESLHGIIKVGLDPNIK